MNSPTTDSSLETRLTSVQMRVAPAATAADRDPASVTIVGVPTTLGREAVAAAYRLGLRVFGENGVKAAKAEFTVGCQEPGEFLRALAVDRGKQRTPPVSARHAS